MDAGQKDEMVWCRFELKVRGQASCDKLHSSERLTSRLVAIDSNVSSSSNSDVAVMRLGTR